VSILAKNAATMAVRPAVEGRWRDALAAFDHDSEINALGLHTHGDTVVDLTARLARHGAWDVTWYGVCLFVEAWPPDRDADAADADDLLAVELEASRRDPYRQHSRLFHLDAPRRG
jgi:hypothetical protein